MCDTPDLSAPESEGGKLFVLCPDFCRCLGRYLAAELEDDPDVLSADLAPVLRAFDGSTLVIVEFSYFDLDYRSEFSAVHETAFAVRDPETLRLHFFGLPPNPPFSLRGIVRRAQEIQSSPEKREKNEAYRGYVIVRPQSVGRVGRSVVSTRAALAELKNPAELRSHIRTAVTEHVELFGTRLAATGTPFMAQDGHLLRCAHVSAWMCHYTAVLRGIVPRRTTAQFHEAADPTGAYGRQYPSEGLHPGNLSTLLRYVDLPAEVLDDRKLAVPHEATWYDRKAVWGWSELPAGARRRKWAAKILTAHVCRYLNSGFPSIVARPGRGASGHSSVLCGYLRARDLVKMPDTTRAELGGDPLHSEVVAFIESDDQDGPYIVRWINDLVGEFFPESDGDDEDAPEPYFIPPVVMTPLPRGLWLSGDAAERGGAQFFKSVLERRRQSLARWAKRPDVDLDPATRAEHKRQLDDLHRSIQSQGSGQLAVRSFATTGSDLKLGLPSRVKDESLLGIIGLTQLPKYVWVVEILDRRLRKKSQPAVRAMVVLDASVVSEQAASGDVGALIVHLPGQVSRLQPGATFDDAYWTPTGLDSYRSGRWNHESESELGGYAMQIRGKRAVTGQ